MRPHQPGGRLLLHGLLRSCAGRAVVCVVARGAGGKPCRRRRERWRDGSDGGAATVHVEDGALDVAGRVGGEEGDRGGDLSWVGYMAGG
jgi:hypothetical protein